MISRFEGLLAELGPLFNLTLHLDSHSACCIQLNEKLKIQMQLEPQQEGIWLFCKLEEVPPGKFREDLLAAALKFNAKADPIPGILGYIADSNELALFQKYPLDILSGERLFGLIYSLSDVATQWQQALQSGRIPS